MIELSSIFPAEVVSVQGKPYLFSNCRIDRKKIPEGLSVYDVADDGADGEFWIVKPVVMVNHWCTIIGKEPVEWNDPTGKYWCPPSEENENWSSEGWFLPEMAETLEDFLGRYDDFKEMASE